ncbi:hypothetical protein PDIG_65220 [Penicillium digitatum PHI26]|uniref:Uncharacterized protein n=3 Tax=Penicillium digitatum TaxID=36651 RepID=K9G1A5_PEND2|nr:hypothetical protein PDIP_74550 [Penicillium digitatum Pd1]EKV07364.1 hypothetical protein PDIP_74550 [Penicillium digitatum Pd1]EKV08658.1 hypothetical protein PDIG_65220 [Penicillium digitatum PHI26]
MIFNRLSDGPATVLSPPREHAFAQFSSQSPFLESPGSLNGCSTSSKTLLPNNRSVQSIPSSFNLSSAPAVPKPSRKRSRDEATFEGAIAPSAPLRLQVPPARKVQPIYGEGMVLLNPQTGLAISAESQTGTWYEQESEAQQAAAAPVFSESNALLSDATEVSRKSQRLDKSAPGLDDIALSSIRQRLEDPSSNDQHRTLNAGPATPSEPLVDDATRLLGIGWQRVNADDDMAPAVRGWTKYIDNQYSAHLHDSQMLMKSRALNAYLVAAIPTSGSSPAFYLFSEDLTQGQLVASSWEACLQNLRSSLIIFEGVAPLGASDRPNAQHISFNSMDTGVPLLQQALSNNPQASSLGEMSGGASMGMEIDS